MGSHAAVRARRPFSAPSSRRLGGSRNSGVRAPRRQGDRKVVRPAERAASAISLPAKLAGNDDLPLPRHRALIYRYGRATTLR